MSKTVLALTLFFGVLTSHHAIAATSCGWPRDRNGDEDALILDKRILDDCYDNDRGLFIIASAHGTVCITELPNGAFDMKNLLKNAKVLKEVHYTATKHNLLRTKKWNEEKVAPIPERPLPDPKEQFTFYPVKAGSNQLIISESKECKTGKTYSAVQSAGHNPATSCQSFSANQMTDVYFQHGEKTVEACRMNRRASKISKDITSHPTSSTSDASQKDMATTNEIIVPGNIGSEGGNKSGEVEARP